MGVEDTHNCECAALVNYVLNRTDMLIQIVHKTTTLMQKFILKFALSPKFTTHHLMDGTHHRCLKEKPLYDKLFKQEEEIPQVDIDKSHQWLCCTHLCLKPEAAICAAQEQTMATHYIRKTRFKQNVNPICRLCCKENETISHIVSGYKLLVGTKYTECHNKVCKYIHWCIIQDTNVHVNPNWQNHKPKSATLITNQLSVTYSMIKEVESAVEANQPDIVILDEKTRMA
eukprot:10507324-Ditylum_brightwellii.AAC.1